MSVAPATAPAQVLSSAAQALAVARGYAASLAAGVIERDRAGLVPWAELTALDASGLLGITVPAAHGGPDLSPVVLAEVIRVIAAVDPPLLLVCFDRSSRTLAAIRAHGAFVVNVLAAPQQELSASFARRGPAADWDGVPHQLGPTGSPRLHGALATLECTVEHRLPGGDHEIVIGRVREAQAGDAQAAPLLFWRGRYASLDGP